MQQKKSSGFLNQGASGNVWRTFWLIRILGNGAGRVTLVCSREQLKILLNTRQCTGQAPRAKGYPGSNVSSATLRNPDVEVNKSK